MIDRYTRKEMKNIWSEDTKYKFWLDIELAVCEAWAEEGVIPLSDIKKLKKAKLEKKNITEAFNTTKHDMTAFLLAAGKNLGDESRWLHLGLTSSDVMDTAFSLQIVSAIDLIHKDLEKIIEVLGQKALEYKDTPIIGRTHGIHAEPTTFGLKLLIWHEEMQRNLTRLNLAKKDIQVGKISGAVGTHATIPPSIEDKVCKKLSLEVAKVSSQILQRDRHAACLSVLGVIASSLEKFATELRSLQRTDIGEVEEHFGEGQTGSSSMPHKKNPELSERICGLARVIRANVIPGLENVALWHERDISHSSVERIIFPDSFIALDYILNIFLTVITELKVNKENMLNNMEKTKGLIYSQRLLLQLVEKGLSRQKAYSIVQQNALKSLNNKLNFKDLILKDKQVSQVISAEELDDIFDYSYYYRYVDHSFKRVGLL